MEDIREIEEVIADIEKKLLNNLTDTLAQGEWRGKKALTVRKYVLRNEKIFDKKTVLSAIERTIKNRYEQAYKKEEQRVIELSKKYPKQVERAQDEFKTNGDETDKAIKNMADNSKGFLNSQQMGEIGEMLTSPNRLEYLERDLKTRISIVRRGALKTATNMLNMSVEKIATLIKNGSITLPKAIDLATKDFLEKGINSVEYSNGRKYNITAYTEMLMRTKTRDITLTGAGEVRKEYGIYTVLISQYNACSITCMPFQNCIFYDDVFSGGNPNENKTIYPLLSEAIRGGLFHPNCRHTSTVFIDGINTVPKDINKEDSAARYRIEQEQRYIERNIRKYKRLYNGVQTEQDKETYKFKIKAWQERQRKLIQSHSEFLKRNSWRESI